MGDPRPDHLFVYGTLQTSAEHPLGDLLRAAAVHVGTGSIQARLYIVEDPDPVDNRYPGALPSPDPADRVYGEVYQVLEPSRVFGALDAYEACSPDWPEPHEFMLRRVEVAMADGGALTAGAYLYTWDVSTARHVPSGRFTEVASEVV